MEIYSKERTLCCPAWLKKDLPENSTPREAWTSLEAQDIRNSILDGTYKYCDEHQCPHLSKLQLNTPQHKSNDGYFKALYSKTNLPTSIKTRIEEHKNGTLTPSTIHFSFDSTCNLKCPSCRVKILAASSKEIETINTTINHIQSQYGKDISTLYITGTGDPFISVSFRNFLRDFNPSLWPKLTKIHLHTNATKWNRQMWESMKTIHPYVKSCEISIDAGTKNTYENRTRIGGNWDELLENLKFISTIPQLKSVKTSFVVQNYNYKEIKTFYDLMISIFGRKVTVFYGRLVNWNTYSEIEYLEHSVHLKSHPHYEDFKFELNKVLPSNNAWTNLNEAIDLETTLI